MKASNAVEEEIKVTVTPGKKKITCGKRKLKQQSSGKKK